MVVGLLVSERRRAVRNYSNSMGNDQSCCCKYVCCGRELDSVSIDDFLEHADTGDILLFNQNTVLPRTHTLANCSWDAVGIFLEVLLSL